MVTAVEPLKQPGDEKLDLLMRTDGTMFPDFPDCPEKLQLPANPQLGDFSFPSRSPVEVTRRGHYRGEVSENVDFSPLRHPFMHKVVRTEHAQSDTQLRLSATLRSN